MVLEISGQGAASGDGFLAARIPKKSGYHMVRDKEHAHVCVSSSLSPCIKPPIVNRGDSTLIILFIPNHLPKALPLNTIGGLSVHPLNGDSTPT